MYYQKKRLALALLALLLVPFVIESGLPVVAAENQSEKQAVKKANKDPVGVQANPQGQKNPEEQMKADHQRIRQQADQNFKKRVKDQLKAKGLPVPKSEQALAESPVTLMVEFDRPPAVLKEETKVESADTAATQQKQKQDDSPAGQHSRVRRDTKKKNIEEIRAASRQVVAEQRPARQAVEKIAKKKAQHEFGYLTNTMSIVAKVKDVQAVQAVAGVKRVTAANIYQPQDLAADQIVQASTVWHQHRLKGDKTVIAIVDTGIDTNHEIMRLGKNAKKKISQKEAKEAIDHLGHGRYSSAKIPYSYNYADGTANTIFDLNKNSMHGMHVAGLAAGYSALPNFAGFNQKAYAIGTAPNAQLLNMKVFSNNGGGASSDDIIAAIEDAVLLKADVINLSLGSTSGNVDSDSPEQRAVSLAAQKGTIPVVAAGNSGLSTSNKGLNIVNTRKTNDTGTIDSPGVSPSALTVASSDNLAYDIPADGPAKLSHLSSFSSYGPTPDLQLKPDITAPGGRLLSSLNGNRYDYKSGTSMATPVMAGSAALFAQSLAGRVPAEKISQHMKTALMNTARPLIDEKTLSIVSPRVQGAGIAQVEDAIDSKTSLTTSQGIASLSLGAFSESKQSLQVFLENQTDQDQTFRYQADHRVWTDGSVPGKPATDKRILGADLSILGLDTAGQAPNGEKAVIKVPAHQRVAVRFGLTLPDRAKNGFVEGYLQFKAVDSAGHLLKKGGKQLAMPYLGYYGDWKNQQIFDRPAWNPDSYFGQSILVNHDQVPLGLNKAGTIIPENIAISSSQGATNKQAQPLVNLWRNAHHVVAEIYQHNPVEAQWVNQQPLRTVSIDEDVLKSYYQRGKDQFTTYGAGGKSWRGDVWNAKTGQNEAVADGQYYYQLSAEAASGRLNDATGDQSARQRLILPIKVDGHGPVIANPQFQIKNQSDQQLAKSKKEIALAADLSDGLSGIDAFGRIGLVINGVLTIVDQPLQEDHQVHQRLSLSLNSDQIRSFHPGQSNQVQILAFDNAGNLTSQSFTISGPGATDLANNSSSESNSPAKGTKPGQSEFDKGGPSPIGQTLTGTGKKEPADEGVLDGADQPIVSFDHGVNFELNMVTAQTQYYDQQTQKLTISGHLRRPVEQLLIGEKQGKRQVVAVDPKTLAFKTVVEAKANAKTAVPIQINAGGRTVFDGGLQFYVDTSLPELNFFNESTLARLDDGTYQVKTNLETYQLSGQAGDNYDGYELTINGDMVATKPFSLIFNQKTTGGLTKFSVPLHLTKGDNRSILAIRDGVGNQTKKKLNVRYYQTNLPAPTVTKDSSGVSQRFPLLLTAKANLPTDNPSDNELTIVYSLNQGRQWQKYQGDLSVRENKTIQFKTVDAYGNQSQVVAVTVNEFLPAQSKQVAVVSHQPQRPTHNVSWPTPILRRQSQGQRGHHDGLHSHHFSPASMNHHGHGWGVLGPRVSRIHFSQNRGFRNWNMQGLLQLMHGRHQNFYQFNGNMRTMGNQC
ncbi:S8 family serine peptidase [Fructobacillus evanidus]|uniref:Subtilisin family (AprE) n=1 Tax=Fructobacillus evanidus TaxID=3064281 RepID=A0ABM9MW20_9LACO|nr:Serine protease [Fructobacillus sp. LMG 32999]CAK1229873.1 Serine protease [Fructobacillus sp. LMG 32999]CAK1232650.1 Serine protease [Fructobacillus sp. LMG 32999]CAK1232819.1 Serine protease [Fructobacillus sp. LMG 32999]CAK1233943.1 Serine protease [Fructobacillus sp. LMG 32999]